MKTNLFFWFFIVALCAGRSFSQQLIINEVSQGATGAQEYVELLVTGTPTCNSTPCMDLRNYIIDDNNGNHATGSGTGIAAGCMRFKNVAFWSCIPIGTIILIYNDADQNPLIPAQDLSMTDGNCRLVIPISDCTLLERHTTLPSTSSITYPGSSFVNCGSWTQLAMANSDDSFQTITASGTLIHSVSWGNNTLAPIIYFAGAASSKVALMNNTVDNNPANQANWVFVTVTGNESPGVANNTANNNWIMSMNNSCQPLLPFSTTVSFANAGCTCNGTATVGANGAIGPFTYTWLPSGGNSTTASNLCAGVYTVTATSSNGCVQSKTVSITSVSSVSLSVASTSISCNGLSNGSSTVIISGGTAPYSYTWSPTGGNSASANSLANGVYTVSVHDANNCFATATTSISQPTSSLNATISSTNVLCFGNNSGAASVTTSGGTPGYSYTWSPSGGNSTTALNLLGGSFSVIVKDANNCVITKSVTISQPASALSAVISSTDILCYGLSNGAANVIASGGSPAYSYSWAPLGGNNFSATGLSAGVYSVSIKDINNCTAIATTTVTQPATALTATLNSANITCFGAANGSASVIANGGTPNYSYTWSHPSVNSSTVNGLAAGNYTVIIKDANNCSVVANLLITEPAQITLSVNSLTMCNNQPGVLTATVAGGVAPFTYNWNGNATGSASISVTNTATSVYTVNVMDSHGCFSSPQTATTNVAGFLNVTAETGYSVCSGDALTLSANAFGGTGNYHYTWQPGNMSGPVQVISIVSSSQLYTLNVTDGCSQVVTKTISLFIYTVPVSEITSSEHAGCAPLCVSFTNMPVALSGLVQTYQWSFGDNATSDIDSPQHCYKKAGNYSVAINYVTVNGCAGTQTLSNYVTVHPKPVAAFEMDKNEISIYNSSVNLNNQSTNANNFSWYFASEGTSHEINPAFTFLKEENQLVLLIAKNEFGCIDSLMKEIKYTQDFTFFAPNAFSPNNDNINELFLPMGTGWNTSKFEMSVYDRWGAKLFETTRYDEGWDGEVQGVKVQNDTYIWKISMYDVFLKHHEFIGHVLVETN